MYCCTSIGKEQKATHDRIVETSTITTALKRSFTLPPAPDLEAQSNFKEFASIEECKTANFLPAGVDDVIHHLKSSFEPADLSQIVSHISDSHPAVCKAALDVLVKQEIDIFMLAIRSKLESSIANQVESIMKEVSNDTKLQEVLRKDLENLMENGDVTQCSPRMSSPDIARRGEVSPGKLALAQLQPISAPTTIQFGSSVYYVDEEEGVIELDVMRVGDSTGSSSVSYATADASAKAGRKYVSTSGKIDFAPGDLAKSIKVKILSDTRWDATLEFQVLLSGVQNAELNPTHSKARVKIIDDDGFPTNKYKAAYAEKGLTGLPKVRLFIEYVKLGFADPDIRRASIISMLLDQLSNVHLIYFLLLKLYLIDSILLADDDEMSKQSKTQMLVVVCVMVIVAQTLLSIALVERVAMRVGGYSRMKLQANLLRKFLNYSEDLRSAVGLSDLMLSITHHSPDLVQNGYLQSLKLCQEFGKMFFFAGYQLFLATGQHSFEASLAGFVPIVVYPVLMAVFLMLRHEKSDALKMEMMWKEKHLAANVEIIAHNARMIIDYQCRSKSMDMIENCIKHLNDAINTSHGNHMLNNQFAPWLSSIIIGVYIMIAGRLVLDGSLSFGAFLVTIDMYQRITQSWHQVYTVVLTMHSSLPALELIFWHMNLPTDLPERRQLHNVCRDIGAEERVRARQQEKEDGILYAIDMLPIKLRDVGYVYREYDNLAMASDVSKAIRSRKDPFEASQASTSKPAEDSFAGIQRVNLEIKQGSLVALVGKRGQGKTTLLKILGGVLVPTGDFYAPTHLRVIHVAQNPMFFSTTLLENLRYGVRADSDDGNIERVLKICRKVMVSEDVIKSIVDECRHQWDEHLSLTQKISLHMARALIANPDVLVIHKPMLAFDAQAALNIMETLKAFVEERGLNLEGDPRLRRRKTCILTTTRIEGCSLADKIIWVSKHGVEEVSTDQLDDTMLAS